MQQVLEAPEMRDEERSSIAIEDGYPKAGPAARATSQVKPHRQPTSLLRAIMAALTSRGTEPIPEYAAITPRHESAIDRVCRVDPYLYIRALSG